MRPQTQKHRLRSYLSTHGAGLKLSKKVARTGRVLEKPMTSRPNEILPAISFVAELFAF
jgi:hypothetical protein